MRINAANRVHFGQRLELVDEAFMGESSKGFA